MTLVDQRPASRGRFWANVIAGAILVIGGIWYFASIPSFGTSASSRNEIQAMGQLREVSILELRFRDLNQEQTGVREFWTADLSGLHRVIGKDGKPLALIPVGLAGADAAPEPPSTGDHPRLGPALPREPWKGYWYRSLKRKDSPPAAWFGFAALPSAYGKAGSRTFVVGVDGRVWAKDLGPGGGDRLTDWPGATDDLANDGWTAQN